ncbi:aromatic ring-hydroxylating dioxygenase subunit alpha [Sphingobium sp.]|uniref:aromatic ring-hydroxylating dioxygenase subunit alpha n=1 Tax=Sphingobium sp. TaxID=1912891 RepID=UPI0028BEF508|nr:aromatic ring-hydroxylating dioxygenase subunit alpha [Sphingobium sp.]
MFACECWYVAALCDELGPGMLTRTIAGEDLILYRKEDGGAVAFIDRCPHRLAPLSLGTRVGDGIQCGYHGLMFGSDGRCTHIPNQEKIPARFRATTLPVVERWGLVWTWLGDPGHADVSKLPADFHWQEEPDWAPLFGYIKVEGNYQLLVDNLLDLSHETFLHQHTIGNAAVAEADSQVATYPHKVEVTREMLDCPPPALFAKAGGFTTNIDRYQHIKFMPPCFVAVEVKAAAAGTGNFDAGVRWWVLNALTPDTETSTHYFWGLPRKFRQDDTALTEMLEAGVLRTFGEDKAIIEAQQLILAKTPLETRTIHIKVDEAPTRAREMVTRMIERERADAVTPELAS